MLNKPNILVIEDDANLSLVIEKYLARNDFKSEVVYKGDEGLKKALSNKHNLVLLDLGLPGIGGIEIIKKIRDVGNDIPIIVITSNGSISNEISSYDKGANLFHRKPIEFDLLISQINNLLSLKDLEMIITMKDIEINTKERIVERNGKRITLTKSEYNLFLSLVNSNGSIFSRKKIIANLLNFNRDLEEGAVDTMICRIRGKFKQYGEEEVIETLYKEGFRITLEYIKEIDVTYL